MAARQATLRDENAELRLIEQRFRFLALIMMLGLLALLARFAWLQVLDHDTYASRADSNRISLQALPPNRGLIVDRHGRVLAENRPSHRLDLIPERIVDLHATLDELASLIEVSEDELARFEQQRRRSRRFQPITLKTQLDSEQVARLAVHRHRLPGVEIQPYLVRHYPHGELLAHVLGYVGRIDENDRQRLGRERYRGASHTGRTGIERFYEERLHGYPGYERAETNAVGRRIAVLERSDPIPGETLQLSLDLDLQRAARDAMGDQIGAVVLMAVETGELLALLSQPGFDPNLFVNGIRSQDYQALLADPQRPLFNRFLNGGYEPGSTIKPVIALAGLQEGVITPQRQVWSDGSFQLPGQQRRYRDWRRGGHGWVDLEAALAESVNVYFYQLAVDLGIDRLSRALALFGLGQLTGIDLDGEQAGILPSRRWKRERFNQPWYPGETVITGIGQGFTVITPLQLAQMGAILAGQGWAAPPRLLAHEPARLWVDYDARHWAAVNQGLAAVIHGPRGTARAEARRVPVRFAGKTGTAQVFGLPDEAELDSGSSPDDRPFHLRNHALFFGFAPAEAPRYVVAVVAEHGGGGASVAAPIAAKVLAAALAAELDEVAP